LRFEEVEKVKEFDLLAAEGSTPDSLCFQNPLLLTYDDFLPARLPSSTVSNFSVIDTVQPLQTFSTDLVFQSETWDPHLDLSSVTSQAWPSSIPQLEPNAKTSILDTIPPAQQSYCGSTSPPSDPSEIPSVQGAPQTFICADCPSLFHFSRLCDYK